MKPFLKILIAFAVVALVVLLWTRRGGDLPTPSAGSDTPSPVAGEHALEPTFAEPTPPAERVQPDVPLTLFGHRPGLTLAEQNEARRPELIQDVPPEVIGHARTHGFPFEGTIVSLVSEHGFWLIAHDPIDAYMWASENRPIHPEDPARLHDFKPGDTVRGTILHGDDRYLLRID